MAGKSIKENLERVHERIARACEKAQRSLNEVRLVAVSKTKPIDMVSEAFHAGQTLFGENYVQEALRKIELLPQAEWHLIGSLQTKKARSIAGKFALIHSVDREKLASEISKAAGNIKTVQDILIQVHIGDESTKSGVTLDEAPGLIEAVLKMPNIRLRGLMSLPPLTGNESLARSYFAQLRESMERWRRETMNPVEGSQFTELSIGTSSDFEWAILEGATYVRIGTAIFGERERFS